MDLQPLHEHTVNGNASAVTELTRQALNAGVPPGEIISTCLIPAMAEVGALYEADEFYVPELILAARAMQAALAILKPLLAENELPSAGRVVIATVKGDLHDIGKNLVATMLQGAGFDVIDLGVDVGPDKFVAAVKTHHPQIVAMSSLLTTTMPAMKSIVAALEEAGVRSQVKVLVGGAPVTQPYADSIGADGYAFDAGAGVRKAHELIR